MTTSIRVSGLYPVRITEQVRTGELDEWSTTGSVEYPADYGQRDETIHAQRRVIVEEYVPAPSEHDEEAEIQRTADSNQEAIDEQDAVDDKEEDK